MTDEPKAMREIHKIREQMYEEFKGLSIHEIVLRVNERADREWERIMGVKSPGTVAEVKKEYKEEEGDENSQQ